MDYHQILGVRRNASAKEIEQAFDELKDSGDIENQLEVHMAREALLCQPETERGDLPTLPVFMSNHHNPIYVTYNNYYQKQEKCQATLSNDLVWFIVGFGTVFCFLSVLILR